MQLIDDRNTYVPDWAIQFYDSGYFWLVVAIAGVIILVLFVAICQQYYELKKAKRILDEYNETDVKNITERMYLMSV